MSVFVRSLASGYRRIAPTVLFATVGTVFLVTGCRSQQGTELPVVAPLPPASNVQPTAASDSEPSSPFAEGPATAAASSTEVNNLGELLQRYPEAKQARIRAWYTDHAPGSMRFISDAQWKWMQQHGYPTPEDILRASSMSESQLRALAARGDVTANFFYLARLLDDHASRSRTSGEDAPLDADRQSLLTASMNQALANGSPFAGYMFGRYYAAIHGRASADIGMAAGLAWADSLGDSNGPFHSRQMAMGFPGVSGVRVAEAYFDMFAAAARANPYFMDTYRGRGASRMPLQ